MERIRRIKQLSLWMILTLSFLLNKMDCASQLKQVWAIGDGEKVFRNELNHPDKNGNSVWDRKTIKLTGLFNEILAFQIITETGESGSEAVEVQVQAPVEKNSGKIIGGNSLKYGPDGTIEVFTEHYLHVTDSTSPAWYYGGPASAPRQMKGWIPDALIPSYALKGRGGFPVRIEANSNQGFWVDIHLPRDQNSYPGGKYTGTVLVTEKGEIFCTIPLEINLLPFYLPDRNFTRVWMVHENISSYYPELTQEQTDEMIKFEGHRHRVDITGGMSINNSPFNKADMDKFRPYLDGSAYTPVRGYHGPGGGIGDDIFSIGSYGSPAMGNTKDEIQKQSDIWVNWFTANAPLVKYFWYIIDEPGEAQHAMIREKAGWVKENPGPGKAMPVFTTTHYQDDLFKYVDIFAANYGVNIQDLEKLKQNGYDHWFYNGNRPRVGSIITEGTAVDFRVNGWIMYKYGVSTWYIWDVTHWRHFRSANMGSPRINMYAHPLTYKNKWLSYGANGDGLLFYPGKEPYYPEENRGLNEIITSIRLKNLRRGQQDALIMQMAEKKSGRAKVMEIVSKVVPKAMSDVDMKDKVHWSEKGNDYDEARAKLLKLL